MSIATLKKMAQYSTPPNQHRTVRAIMFDLDDTLWQSEPVLKRAHSVFHDYLQIHYPKIIQKYPTRLDFQKMMKAISVEQNTRDFSILRRAALARMSQNVGYESNEVVEKCFKVFLSARSNVDFFDGVIPMLNELKDQQYVLGSITNGNADVALIKELSNLFDFNLSPSNTGYSKPHPRIFETAIRFCGCEPHEILHVGDSYECDVEGAKNLGIRTMFVKADYEGATCSSHSDFPGADYIVSHVTQLTQQLKKL